MLARLIRPPAAYHDTLTKTRQLAKSRYPAALQKDQLPLSGETRLDQRGPFQIDVALNHRSALPADRVLDHFQVPFPLTRNSADDPGRIIFSTLRMKAAEFGRPGEQFELLPITMRVRSDLFPPVLSRELLGGGGSSKVGRPACRCSGWA